MGKADHLSRQAGHDKGKADNKDMVLLKPQWLRVSKDNFLKSQFECFSNHHNIRALTGGVEEATVGDHFYQAIVNAKHLWEDIVKDKDKDFDVREDTVWCDDGRLYVPNDPDLRTQILKHHHDTYIAGHPGRFKTQELISRNYWWPSIRKDVRKYCAACPECQRTKSHRFK
jgi:hypothetical protein